MKTLDNIISKTSSFDRIKNTIRNISLTALIATTMGIGGYLSPAKAQETVEYNKQTESEKKFRIGDLFSFEFELIKGCANQPKSDITIANVPEYVRDVPRHPDDGSSPVPYLPNKQLSMEYGNYLLDCFGLKCWLLNVIGVGIGLRALSFDSEAEIEHFAPDSRAADYNYTGNPWAGAYTMYQAFVETDTDHFRYFFEVKSPRISFNFPGDDAAGFCFFGGYEPNVGSVKALLGNGYYRYNKVEISELFKLAECKVDRFYLGLELGLAESKALSNKAAMTFSYVFHKMDKNISAIGKESGIKIDKPGGLFVIGPLCFRWKF